MFSLKSITFIFLSLLKETTQSHWKGDVIYWQPVDPSVSFPITETNVRITQRYASNLYYDSDICASQADLGQSLINYDNGYLESQNGPYWETSTTVVCKEYNFENNWQGGERVSNKIVSTTETIHARYQNGDWISGIHLTPSTDLGNRDWFYDVYIDLKRRGDTGKINSSPQTTAGYPIYLSTNCEGGLVQRYVIPVSDPDGDVVRCRCYNNDCFSGLTLDTNACSFTFVPPEVGWYAIFITIEDFAPNDLNVPLSSIPLIIGAYVDSNPSKCCKFNFSKL